MSLIDNSMIQLRRDEDEVLHVYQDSLGFWTLGIGTLVDERKGGIDKEESAWLFQHRFNKKVDELQRALPWFGTLSEARRGVLVNMSYQMGVAGLLTFKKFLQYLQQGNYEVAAREMLDSTWAKQTSERAKRLSEQVKLDRWM
jgi:lysozyme